MLLDILICQKRNKLEMLNCIIHKSYLNLEFPTAGVCITKSVRNLINYFKLFNLQNATRASVAAAPLAQWVKANIQYSKVLEKIEPLEREQNELKK